MKKYLLFLFLLISPVMYSGFRCGDCDCNIVSHSFFSVRPLYQSASPERVTLFRDRLHACEDGWNGTVQLTFFGSRTKEPWRLASFFGPSCKPQFTVTSANTGDIGDHTVTGAPEYRDIVAQHFNIYFKNGRVFEGFFCLDPEQTVAGLGITYKQGIYERDNGKYFWIELSSPLTHIKNQMCIHETVKSDGELLSLDAVGSISEAFRQCSWNFGKIDPYVNHIETRFADLEAKIGYEWLSIDCCFLESYIGVLIPTGNCVSAKYVFEPIVGHNQHTGATMGSSGIFEWWSSEEQDCYAQYAFDWHSLYLFEKIEMRSFDLKGKPWSRYMPVYRNKDQAQLAAQLWNNGKYTEAILLHTPGINVFTQPLCVNPGFAHTFNSAFILTCKNVRGEIGYNVFARSAECVRLTCCWEEGPALKDISGKGDTNHVNTINETFNCTEVRLTVTYYDDNIITECDLDLASAAHPAMISHTIYGSLGCYWDDSKFSCFIGTGCAYEFANDNAALDRWIAWIKGGISF
ncbi:hypothetical protein E3J79_02280 [Candidatus Dependentiae bacterium]|nr:MAG: hypothetical protein E3J79_02280 [Candidatus Dependentiae bacterium]